MDAQTLHEREIATPGSVLVEGGPGTGKTATLIDRATQAIRDGLRPERVIVVVPSRPAAKQFRAALLERVGQRASAILIGRPEDIARLELRSCGVSISLAKGGIVTKCTKIAAQTVAGLGWREVRTLITGVKCGKSRMQDLSEDDLLLIQRYNAELRKRRFWDAQDILRLAIDAYEDGRLPAMVYQAAFVDDGQELQPIAHQWLQKHVEAGVAVVMSGCREQTVFGFAGAAGGPGLDDFKERAKASAVQLGASRRCSAALLKAASNITNVTASPPAGADHETAFTWHPVESQREEIDLIAREAANGHLAVLARSNRYLDRIEVGLIGYGVGYTRRGGSTVLTHPAFRALIDILRVCDEPGEDSLVRSLSWLDYNNRAWRTLVREEAISDGAWGLFKNGVPDRLPDVHPLVVYVRNLRRWHDRASSDPTATFREIAEWLSQRRDGWWLSRLVSLPDSLGEDWSSLGDIASQLEALLFQAMNAQPEDRPITLSTIHAARGQEFDHVWVAGVADGHCPDPRLSLQDELMLLYVATTRARYSLSLSGVGHPDTEWLHAKIASQTGRESWRANA